MSTLTAANYHSCCILPSVLLSIKERQNVEYIKFFNMHKTVKNMTDETDAIIKKKKPPRKSQYRQSINQGKESDHPITEPAPVRILPIIRVDRTNKMASSYCKLPSDLKINLKIPPYDMCRRYIGNIDAYRYRNRNCQFK